MADVGHFGCANFTFDRISGHFRSIRNFNFFGFFFDKMADVGHFGCPKFTFDRISGHFRSIGHFRFPKFTFDRNSGYFRSIRDFFFRRPFWMSENHFGSHFWPFQIDRPFWMSEIHFRWHFWSFQIHTELYFYFFIFDKMAAGGHLGCCFFKRFLVIWDGAIQEPNLILNYPLTYASISVCMSNVEVIRI